MKNENQHAFFIVKRARLVKVLKQLKIYVVNKKSRYKTMCEITIVEGRVNFNAPGATFAIEAQTGGTAKASIDLDIFWRLVNTYQQKELRIAIEKFKLIIDKFSLSATTTFFDDDSILRSTVLPANYSELDLLAVAMSNKYTVEELEFNNLWIPINQAERRLRINLNAALKALNTYGITRDDIEEFVTLRIQKVIVSIEDSLDTQKKLDEKGLLLKK